MNIITFKSLALAAALAGSSIAFAGSAPVAAAAAPSGSIVTNSSVLNALVAINGTTQSPAVVNAIGTQVANAGGSYNAATGNVQAFVDTGANGIFVLTIENGQISFTPAES